MAEPLDARKEKMESLGKGGEGELGLRELWRRRATILKDLNHPRSTLFQELDTHLLLCQSLLTTASGVM